MYNRSIYPIGTRRKSIDLGCFGMGRFRIVGTRLGMPVIQVRLDSWKVSLLAEMGVLAI